MRDHLFFPNGITNMHGGEGGEGLLLVMNLTQAWRHEPNPNPNPNPNPSPNCGDLQAWRYEPASDVLSHWADFHGSGDNIRTNPNPSPSPNPNH